MNVASYNYIPNLHEIVYKSNGKYGLECRDIGDGFTTLHFTYSIESLHLRRGASPRLI